MLRSIHARRFVVYDCYSLDVISHYIVDLNRHSWSFFVSHFFQNNIVSCKRAYIDIEIQDTEVLERSGILFYTNKKHWRLLLWVLAKLLIFNRYSTAVLDTNMGSHFMRAPYINTSAMNYIIFNGMAETMLAVRIIASLRLV